MTYIKVKKLMEENPNISREEVMKKAKCGDLQAAAWMQRYKAEVAGKKRSAFEGRYNGPEPKPSRAPGERKTVSKRSTGKGATSGRER